MLIRYIYWLCLGPNTASKTDGGQSDDLYSPEGHHDFQLEPFEFLYKHSEFTTVDLVYRDSNQDYDSRDKNNGRC